MLFITYALLLLISVSREDFEMIVFFKVENKIVVAGKFENQLPQWTVAGIASVSAGVLGRGGWVRISASGKALICSQGLQVEP